MMMNNSMRKTYSLCTNAPQLAEVQGSRYPATSDNLVFVHDGVIRNIDEHVHERDGDHGERRGTLDRPHGVADLC